MTGFSALPLAEQGEDQYADTSRWKGVSRILGPSWFHLPTLTVGLLGVQIFWSVEMSYASPYLLSLGLSKSSMAIVFVAGPLSGLVMQPLIGVLADNSTSRWGRRRPYILMGTLVCIFAMILLGFTRPIAAIFTGFDNLSNDTLTIWFAVLAIYLIDFSINAVQATDRALLVDVLPPSAQASGNAWAARMLGMGSVVGFFAGNMDLHRLFPFLGKNQLQVLAVIVSFLLLAGHLLTASLVRERVLLNGNNGKTNRKSILQELKDIWTNMITLPKIIRQICIIQFFAWVGWFPTLFYTTVYIGDLYKRSVPLPSTPDLIEDLNTEATRLGSRALFYSSVAALIVNILLPIFVAEAARERADRPGRKMNGGAQTRNGSGDEASWWTRICKIPVWMQVHLATLWALSHAVFAGCMLATFFTESVFGASLLITVTGFSWAITQWVPFSLLAEAILTEPTFDDSATQIRLTDTRTRREIEEGEEAGERDVFLPGDDGDEGDEDPDADGKLERSNNDTNQERQQVMGNYGAQLSRLDISSAEDVEIDESEGRGSGGSGLSANAGIILGIHNVFIVIPQFLVTGLSAVIFAIFDPEKSVLPPKAIVKNPESNGTVLATVAENVTGVATVFLLRSSDEGVTTSEVNERAGQSNSVVYIFRIGGLAAAIAFVLCWRLARELKHR